jgi:hypothetical protein
MTQLKSELTVKKIYKNLEEAINMEEPINFEEFQKCEALLEKAYETIEEIMGKDSHDAAKILVWLS